MNEPTKYTIFHTKWGCFGLLAGKNRLLRSCLPCPNRRTVERCLLAGLNNPRFDKNLLKMLQHRIVAYFNGLPVNFDTPLILNHLSPFTRKVLTGCTKIPYGKTISYSQLAAKIGKPHAARAVGNALAKNPIPLIIPCHRVIRSNGSIGHFFAPGGTPLKRKLIHLESASKPTAL